MASDERHAEDRRAEHRSPMRVGRRDDHGGPHELGQRDPGDPARAVDALARRAGREPHHPGPDPVAVGEEEVHREQHDEEAGEHVADRRADLGDPVDDAARPGLLADRVLDARRCTRRSGSRSAFSGPSRSQSWISLDARRPSESARSLAPLATCCPAKLSSATIDADGDQHDEERATARAARRCAASQSTTGTTSAVMSRATTSGMHDHREERDQVADQRARRRR